MKRSLIITYTLTTNPAECRIPLRYELNRDGNLLTLNCAVDLKSDIPSWLQLRKFSVTSQLVDGQYLTLYNERNDSANFDSSLFIDTAYAAIMKKENIRLHETAAL